MKRLANALALFQGLSVVTTGSRILKAKLGAVVLGAEGVGVLSQVANINSLITTGSGLGTSNGLIRRVADCYADEDWAGLRRQLTTVLLTLLVSSLTIVTVAVVFSSDLSDWLLDDDGVHAGYVAIALIAVPFAMLSLIHRGVLNGLQLPKDVVHTEILAELCSLIAFIGLVLSVGLLGACVSLVVLQMARFLLLDQRVRRHLGGKIDRFHWQQFDARELAHNAKFGVVGLLLVCTGIFATITVTRMVIGQLGLADGGVFSVAWKVSAVYLGALYAAASNYLFPGLVAALRDGGTNERVNEALTLYAYVVPPLAAGVMLGGEWLIELLFSAEFGYAAIVLLFLLPGDLMRITAETTGLTLLACSRLVPYALVYLVWAASFVLLSSVWLPRYGLLGVGYAYIASQFMNMCLAYIASAYWCDVRLTRSSVVVWGRAAVLLVSLCLLLLPGFGPSHSLLFGVAASILWFSLSCLDKPFRQLIMVYSAGVSRRA